MLPLVSTHKSLLKRDANHRQRGFTIVETSIAFVVMMVAVLGAASLFSFAIKYNSSANDRALSTAVAQQQLEQLRNRSFTDASLAATTGAGRSSTVTNAGRPYTVVITISDSNLVNGLPTLKTIDITVAPAGGGLGTVALRTLRSSIRLGPNR